MTTELVFVYGSLKRGFHNHPRFLGHARFLGEGTTARPYLMRDAGAYPFVIDPATLTCTTDLSGMLGCIKGEVYAIGPETMDALDFLEGHPDFYCRKRIAIKMDNPAITATIPAWCYLLPSSRAHLVKLLAAVMPDEASVVTWSKPRGAIFNDGESDDADVSHV